MDPWSAVWLWEWLRRKRADVLLFTRRQAAFRGSVLTTLQMCTACKQITQSGADDPRHALQKSGGLADLWYMDDGDISVSPNLGAIPPAGIRHCQRQSWSGVEPVENRSHLPRERPGCSAS